ncbi:MAG: HAD family hydrolase [Ruminococcaceae bacterium]|nr:HAD family hydrolase [Oscillospiraceae bacterium]
MKLIITDLDNTLLTSDKNISEYTVRVLEECRKQGHMLAFATARSEASITRFVEMLKPNVIVSNGGAVIRSGGEVIYQNLMSAQDVSKIIEMFFAFTDGKGLMTLDCEDGYYCNFRPSDADRYGGYVQTDFKEFKCCAHKITAGLERDEWAEKIAKACPDCTVVSFTGEIWRGISAKNSDKGTALSVLVSHLGIGAEDVIAFGDDTNDIGMLKLAGTAVAVLNAIDEVKAVAEYVTDSNDQDGVARFLQKTLLA